MLSFLVLSLAAEAEPASVVDSSVVSLAAAHVADTHVVADSSGLFLRALHAGNEFEHEHDHEQNQRNLSRFSRKSMRNLASLAGTADKDWCYSLIAGACERENVQRACKNHCRKNHASFPVGSACKIHGECSSNLCKEDGSKNWTCHSPESAKCGDWVNANQCRDTNGLKCYWAEWQGGESSCWERIDEKCEALVQSECHEPCVWNQIGSGLCHDPCKYAGVKYGVCDGRKPEPESSTEACEEDQFTCVADKFCIPAEYKCDGFSDCKDGSDEQECNATSTNKKTRQLQVGE